MLTLTSIFLCALAVTCWAEYVPRCNLKNPHLGQCIEDAANVVIPKLISGNKDFNFPTFEIFPVPDIISSPCKSGFKFKLANITAGNLADARAIFTSYDVVKVTCNMTLYFPRLKVTGNYELDGNINGLAVRGAGQADITLTEIYSQMIWLFGTQIIEGTRHIDVLHTQLHKYSIKGAKYSFSGLSNGDEALGKKASEHINNNWRVLEQLISPVVMESFRKIVYHISKTFHNYVPAHDVFLEDVL